MSIRPLIAPLAACLLAGCGNAGGGDNTGPLLERLPSGSTMVGAVDFAEARERLGLPEDTGLKPGGTTGEQRLIAAGAHALPHLVVPVDDPILEVLDHTRIVAAASGAEDATDRVTVVRTTQSPGQVLEGLLDEGYEREGDLVTADDLTFAYRAAAKKDGLLFLAADDDALEQVLDDEPEEPSRATRLLRDTLEGPVRVVFANPDEVDCLSSVSAQDSLDPAEGEFILSSKERADPKRVRLSDCPRAQVRFEQAEADGDALRVRYSYDTKEAPSPSIVLLDHPPVDLFYDCD